jgi:hypothetical protein
LSNAELSGEVFHMSVCILPTKACGALQVEMYPSKSDGMFVRESLIFRSDSNGEDLEGYAGAGLYDSITMDKTELRKVDYASDKWAFPLPANPGCKIVAAAQQQISRVATTQ